MNTFGPRLANNTRTSAASGAAQSDQRRDSGHVMLRVTEPSGRDPALALAFMNPEDLTINPRNARTHSARQIKQLAETIRQIGFVTPIIVDDTGMILAGHGRHRAAL